MDANRNYESSFGHSKWSLFGKIVRQLGDDFERTMPQGRKQELLDHLTNAHDILKTRLYLDFEGRVKNAFEAQLRGTTHTISFDFKTFDPLNFYKNLHPTLSENGSSRNPSEAGSGMRNLIVLALFRAYGEMFRSNAIIAIEEPEIYLHPHAQRSLSSLFETLTVQGAQLFMSTHSAAFLSPDRADRIVRVRQLPDEEEELCTQVKHVPPKELLKLRQQLRPATPMTVQSMQERYRNICTVEHCEAFFASCVVLVEGPTERAALPIYSKYLGLDFNEFGISVVNASGKGNLDTLFHLYSSIEIPVFIVFDNDRNGDLKEQSLNPVLLRMLGRTEEQMPAAVCDWSCCILECNYEVAVRADVEMVRPGLYAQLRQAAVEEFGDGKPIIARYMARKLVEQDIVPLCVRKMLEAIDQLVRPSAPEEEELGFAAYEDHEIPF